MFTSPDARIVLRDLPPPAATAPALATAFIGAAPAAVARDRAADALAYAARLGFLPDADDLTRLPLAFDSAAAFSAAFPGDESWLAASVKDFFRAGGRRAIVIRVPASDDDPAGALAAQIGAGAASAAPMAGVNPSIGLDIALCAPEAGLVLLPDLERLCFRAAEARLAAAPKPPRATPMFRPLADLPPPRPDQTSGDAPERPPLTPADALGRINAALAARRPDMQALFALPIGADETLSTHALTLRAKAYLYGEKPDSRALPQIQALAPMLRGAGAAPSSPSGFVAGMLAGMAETGDLWRSLHGRPLPPGLFPARAIENRALADLRGLGVTALRANGQGAAIEGDVMAFPTGAAERRSAANRRLMGCMVRDLRQLGEQLVFENNTMDGRVELILLDYFDELQKAGALPGIQVTDAVAVKRGGGGANVIAYDVAVRTALALETIQLRFAPSGVSVTSGGAA